MTRSTSRTSPTSGATKQKNYKVKVYPYGTYVLKTYFDADGDELVLGGQWKGGGVLGMPLDEFIEFMDALRVEIER